MNLTVQNIEQKMLAMEQADCPVRHILGEGLYIRELSMKAGTLAIGHMQKTRHLNVFIKGKVLMLNDDGTTSELSAPITFFGEANSRKIGYVIEDLIWQNIYATNETDIDKLEETYLLKSEYCLANEAKLFADKQDYQLMLTDIGFTDDLAYAMSTNELDRIDIYSDKVIVTKSPIHGKGLFATYPIEAGELIMMARINGNRTQAGRYTNHSATPNAEMKLLGKDVGLYAIKSIQGNKGGQNGDEITIDYRQALKEVTCQQ